MSVRSRRKTKKRMKINFVKVMVAATIVTMTFAACKKDDKPADIPTPGPGGSTVTTIPRDISATDVRKYPLLGDPPAIAVVKAYLSAISFTGGVGQLGHQIGEDIKYENNGFKVTLPESVPTDNLDDRLALIAEIFMTDATAKTGVFTLLAINDNGSIIGYFRQAINPLQIPTTGFWVADYVYTDKDFDLVKDNVEIAGLNLYANFNGSLKKGWNIVYIKPLASPMIMTTTKPSNATFNWYYTKDYLPDPTN